MKKSLPMAVLCLGLLPTAQAADPMIEIDALKQRIAELERSLKPAAANAPAPAADARGLAVGGTTISWSGYIKADAIYSRFSEAEVAQGIGRDTYVPNTIPVSSGNGDSHSTLDLHAKETRLVVKSETPLDGGGKIATLVEADFIVAQGAGSERVTNAYNPGLRRAYVSYGPWLAGQDWTTFINLASLPETLDFVAFPTEGTVFVRQPMLRYTHGNLALALENPETTTAPLGGGAYTDNADSALPDLVARYAHKYSGGSETSLAVLVRQLKVDNASPAADADATAAGVSLAGKLALGKDNLTYQLNYGDGIGRYLALATVADAVLDGNELETIRIASGYLAYKHQWSPAWRSTATVSHLSADQDIALSGGAVTKKVTSGSINLLYSPAPKLTFGVEYRHAERETENGDDGTLDRVQFSTKYLY